MRYCMNDCIRYSLIVSGLLLAALVLLGLSM